MPHPSAAASASGWPRASGVGRISSHSACIWAIPPPRPRVLLLRRILAESVGYRGCRPSTGVLSKGRSPWVGDALRRRDCRGLEPRVRIRLCLSCLPRPPTWCAPEEIQGIPPHFRTPSVPQYLMSALARGEMRCGQRSFAFSRAGRFLEEFFPVALPRTRFDAWEADLCIRSPIVGGDISPITISQRFSGAIILRLRPPRGLFSCDHASLIYVFQTISYC
jgi:hypothetical protein